MKRRLFELISLLFVGDAVLTVLNPQRHCLLWEIGPEPCRKTLHAFVDHPIAGRWAAIAQLAIACWIAERQEPTVQERLARW